MLRLGLGCLFDTFDLSVQWLELVHVSNFKGIYTPWSQGIYQTSKALCVLWLFDSDYGAFDPPTQREMSSYVVC